MPMDNAMNGAMLKHSAQMRGVFGSGAGKARVAKPRGKGLPAEAAIRGFAPHQAVYNLEGSGFVRDVLGGDLVETWLEHKRREYREYLDAERLGESEARQWELKRYLERV